MKRGREKQPAFGIVGTPVETAVASGGVRQAIDAAAYGLMPRERLRTDSAGPDPAVDDAVAAARSGDLATVAATLAACATDPDRHTRVVGAVAEVAVRDEGWLYAWLDAAPGDAHAWCVHAYALVSLAWELRTAASGKDVLREQWIGFRRVLGQAPEASERATALAPGLATPWMTLMSCAQGLGWDHARFNEIWGNITARAPYSVAAHQRALSFWLPRWRGSAELAAAFVAETMARAEPGRLLTSVRLQYLFMERIPSAAAQRTAFYQGPEVTEAIDMALADLAAAPADHPFRQHQRHWLAYFLTRAGRYAEAVEQFRAVDGYAGGRPWDLFNDPVDVFVSTRAEALLGWQSQTRSS
jgi:hypothetical protein